MKTAVRERTDSISGRSREPEPAAAAVDDRPGAMARALIAEMRARGELDLQQIVDAASRAQQDGRLSDAYLLYFFAAREGLQHLVGEVDVVVDVEHRERRAVDDDPEALFLADTFGDGLHLVDDLAQLLRHRARAVHHQVGVGQAAVDLGDDVHLQHVAGGLLGELVGAVAGADGHGQGVAAGVGDPYAPVVVDVVDPDVDPATVDAGILGVAHDVLHAELIDPDSGTPKALEPGAEGELVLTHLARDCQPLVRFRTGDIIAVDETGGCTCGRTGFRFRVIGRSDDMVVVRGVNLYPSAVEAVVSGAGVTGEYRVEVDERHALPAIRMQAKQDSRLGSHPRSRLLSSRSMS